MTSLLSTGKKKAKASRVFGGDLFHENDISLCYSLSPGSSKQARESCSLEDASPIPTVLFGDTKPQNNTSIVENTTEHDKENVSYDANESLDRPKGDMPLQSTRTAELNRLRVAKSPLRRNLAQQTEAAIFNATLSVSKTLNSSGGSSDATSVQANRGMKQAHQERTKQSKSVRFQGDERLGEPSLIYNKVQENRRQLLALQRKIASAHFKEKARRDESKRAQRIAELDKNSHFNSEVFRDHQQKLKEERERNRKKSMEARSKLRQNKKEGEEKLEAIKQQEEAAIFEIRHDLHRARNEAARANALERRKSFQFRAGDAKRIQKMRSQWQQDELNAQHAAFELDRAAARDVDEYKRELAAQRRDSFKARNADGRRRRIEEQNQTNAAMLAEHKSYELKWAGEKDAEQYHRQMQEERRKSLAGRNKESVHHAKVMQELQTLRLEKEAESFMLKFAAEKDAKEYISQLAKERRESLQLRGQEARRAREFEDEQRRLAIEETLKEGALQSNCQKDIEEYKKAMAERDRKSLQYRAKEKKLQRLEMESRQQKQREIDDANFNLDSLARMDVEEYIKDCKKRRRQSLAFRAKEKRRHAVWKQQQEEKEIEARHETGYLQALDYQYMALAQQQERARIAMDALRNAGCIIKGNPFGDLLDL